ncbi:hypothetical protein M9Y10_016870 [Tritrichomonas musculus]|uniref:Nucleoside diphosphate kinase-like domain-containing protein n=1 Tax=Tritrichomonas musculus TaxID=1915356 RepID=A0ABR2HXC5_9EUKA
MTEEHTLLIIEPGYQIYWGRVVDFVLDEGFKINQMQMTTFDNDFSDNLFRDQIDKDSYSSLRTKMTSGPVVVLDIVGKDCISHFQTILAPSESESISEKMGLTVSLHEFIYCTSSIESVANGLQLVFGSIPPEMILHTYAMIKPGYDDCWGKIVQRILDEGLEIVQMKTMEFDDPLVEKFYAEHIGTSFYPALQAYITSGPVVAIELSGLNAIKKWREIIGPTQKELALEKAPNSLRALYARNTTENLCHGSDSIESAVRELTIIFGSAPEYMIPKLEPAEFDEETLQEMDQLEDLALDNKEKPSHSDLKQQYLDETVMPLVLEGITWIMKERPIDPVEHLAMFLLKNNHPKQPEEEEAPVVPEVKVQPPPSKK